MSWLVCVSRPRFLTPRPTHTHEPRLHPARPGLADVGLERRHHPNQGAFHRIALDLAAEVDQDMRAFQLARPAPHPFACRDPIQPRQWLGGRFKLPRPRRIALRLTAWGTEKMRLPDVCNRPTTRAPYGSIDSHVRPRSALRLSFVRRSSLQAGAQFEERARDRSHERPRWSFA